MSQSWGPNTPPPPGAPGWTPPPPPAAPKKKGAGCAKIGCLGVLGVAAAVIAFAAVSAGKSASTPTSTSASSGTTTVTQTQTTKAAAPASPQTVTYVVTGASDADIQYGPSGSNSQGHAPMNLTQKLGNPAYYSITAQLQGSGSVSCKLEVDGKVISQATANGGYNIATCEISQDPINGGWQDTNQG